METDKYKVDWTPNQIDSLGKSLNRFFGRNNFVAILAIREFLVDNPNADKAQVFESLSHRKSCSGNNHATGSGMKEGKTKRGRSRARPGVHWHKH